MQHNNAFRIALVYGLLATTWILLSDSVVWWLIPSIASSVAVEIAKGVIFVLVTSGLLYLLLRRNERAQADMANALRQSEAHFRTLIEKTNDGIAIVGVDGLIQYISPYITSPLGYEPRELHGSVVLDYLHPDDKPRATAMFEQVVTTPSESARLEVRFPRKDGSWTWQEVVVTNLLAEPNVRGIVLNYRDSTERKEAEAQTRFQAHMLNSVGQAVIATNMLGEIIYWNRAAERMYGWMATEAVGARLIDLIVPPHAREQGAQLMQRLRGGTSWAGEFEVQRRDGSTFPAQVTNELIPDEQGRAIGVVGVSFDISERRQHARELEGIVAVSTALRRAETRTQILTILLNELLPLLNAEGAAVVMPDGRASTLQVKMARGVWAIWDGLQLSWEDTISQQVLLTRNPYLSNDVANDRFISGASRKLIGHLKAVICIPLVAHEQVLGAMWVGSSGTFATSEVHLLTAIGDIAANAIHRATLRERTEQLLRDEKSARAEAERERQQIRAIFDQAPAMMAIATGEDHVFEQANKVFLQVVGKHDIVGKSLLEVFPELGSQGIKELMEEVYNSGQPYIGIEQLISLDTDNDGTPEDHYFNLVYQPTRDTSNQINAILIHAVDVTEQVLARREIESKSAEVQFLIKEVKRRLERVAALQRMAQTISSSVDLHITLDTFIDQVTTQLDVDAAAVLILNPHSLTLTYATGRGFRDASITTTDIKLGESLAGQVALERRNQSFPDLSRSRPDQLHPELEQMFARENIRSYFAVPLLAKGAIKGVLELYNRTALTPDAEWLEFMQALATVVAIAIDNVEMFASLQRSNQELALAYDATIEGWSQALDLRDKETEGHSQRVTNVTMLLARAMGLRDEELVHIRRGALLHDIGKMGIPDAILLKPGPLTDEEWEIMRRHPVYGYQLLAPIEFLRPALNIPYCHHEKWDGTGYPQGLEGDAIPLAARIFAIVDVWDALCSARPYRPAWSEERVRAFLQEQSGTHFDPQVVAAFLALDLKRVTE